ncbi:MAG: UDP-glucose 4-epimerase GalE [Opitutales bacterium]|nr:UDP-glucose 4-epimerase GalE [Opitutales bacterium]MBR7106313.1 UDP-glucose 4-epimerase GalE [Opitutales bacterium]
MKVLVIGGAGYIGSHCVRQLIEAGHTPVVLDNLVYGHKGALLPSVKFYLGNLEDKKLVGEILDKEQIEIVMHFAAFINVGESVMNPIKYYYNNLSGVITLIDTMLEHGVKKFVFSSTCATYGVPNKLPLTEDHIQLPINPYGQTKLDVENFLKACAKAYGLSFVALRYFNASGAAVDGTIGEDHTPETHLIPLTIFAATGKRPALKIFGNDYNTPDGTCLRDYIHVDDLCRAHIAAFKNLEKEGSCSFYNLGTGTPNSVLEIIKGVEEVTGLKVPVEFDARRAGDPDALYANSQKAKTELNWEIKFNDVRSIIETAWRWHKNNPNGFPKD